MVGLEIGTIVHYVDQFGECRPATVLYTHDGEPDLIVFQMYESRGEPGRAGFSHGVETNVPYMDRDGGHPAGTWHWIHGHTTMQGCREDLD